VVGALLWMMQGLQTFTNKIESHEIKNLRDRARERQTNKDPAETRRGDLERH
jgi:hypothetical protein